MFSIQFVYSPGITRHNSVKLDSHLDVLMFGLGGDFFIHETGFRCSGRINTSPGELRQWKYFCKRCQSSSCTQASCAVWEYFKAEVYLPYPPKTQHVGTLLHRHITPQDSWCVPAWGSVCHKRQIVRCVGRAWSTPALLTSLWKQRWGQSRQAWHLETTLIKSNFLILEGRETRSDSLLATALQF